MSDYIKIGKIVNTFGIKGELKIQTDSDFIEERFSIGSHIYLKERNNYKEYKITSFRYLKGNVVITINDMKDINLVSGLIGYDVYASSDDEISLDEGEFYIDDLIGMKVYDNDKKYIGIVNDVIILPSANDILEINKEDGTKELVPFIDEFILDIDDVITIKRIEVADD